MRMYKFYYMFTALKIRRLNGRYIPDKIKRLVNKIKLLDTNREIGYCLIVDRGD